MNKRCRKCDRPLSSGRNVCNTCIYNAVKKVVGERKAKEGIVTKRERTKVMKLLADIEKSKVKMAAIRDTMRDQISDLEGVLDSLSDGLESFEQGKEYFERGLDSFSQYV